MNKTSTCGGTAHSTTTAVYTPGKVTSTIEDCNGQVRYHRDKLQQLWNVRGVGTTGAIESISHEWRDVPTDDEP